MIRPKFKIVTRSNGIYFIRVAPYLGFTSSKEVLDAQRAYFSTPELQFVKHYS